MIQINNLSRYQEPMTREKLNRFYPKSVALYKFFTLKRGAYLRAASI